MDVVYFNTILLSLYIFILENNVLWAYTLIWPMLIAINIKIAILRVICFEVIMVFLTFSITFLK